jgi:hypothetical protein
MSARISTNHRAKSRYSSNSVRTLHDDANRFIRYLPANFREAVTKRSLPPYSTAVYLRQFRADVAPRFLQSPLVRFRKRFYPLWLPIQPHSRNHVPLLSLHEIKPDCRASTCNAEIFTSTAP